MNRGQKFGENEQKDYFNHCHLPINNESSPHWALDFVVLPPYQPPPDFACVARRPTTQPWVSASQVPRGPLGSGAVIVQGKLACQWIGPASQYFFSLLFFFWTQGKRSL